MESDWAVVFGLMFDQFLCLDEGDDSDAITQFCQQGPRDQSGVGGAQLM